MIVKRYTEKKASDIFDYIKYKTSLSQITISRIKTNDLPEKHLQTISQNILWLVYKYFSHINKG